MRVLERSKPPNPKADEVAKIKALFNQIKFIKDIVVTEKPDIVPASFQELIF